MSTDDVPFPAPPEPAVFRPRKDRGWYPPTFVQAVGGAPVPQISIFDPAVMEHADGYRLAGPDFDSSSRATAWTERTRAVGAAVLDAVATSGLVETLLLRGSWLLWSWLGDLAREPHDIDFVALRPAQPLPTLEAFREALAATPGIRQSGVVLDEVRTGPIWTYDRVEGRRLALPWSAGGDVGVLQVDITFDEGLDEDPGRLALPGGAEVLAASPSQSLTWKLEWLMSDIYPQGKDLFDAALLHELAPLTAGQWDRLLRRLAEHHEAWWVRVGAIGVADTEWAWFAEEYPDLAAGTSAEQIGCRLTEAIAALRADSGPAGPEPGRAGSTER